MHYAVPAILAKEGLLARFYTDVVGNSGAVGAIERWVPEAWRSPSLRRLFGRRLPPELTRDRVLTVAGISLVAPIAARLTGRFVERLPESWRGRLSIPSPAEAIQRNILRDGFGGANAYYGLVTGDPPILREAKRRGLYIVYEQILNPNAAQILREERRCFPGLEPDEPDEVVDGATILDRQVWDLADVVLVPSEFVRETTIAFGCAPEKVALVPYGLPPSWLEKTASPVPGRVLFVGTVGLRKGNHYLAQAARILRERGIAADVRVVGPPTTPTITSSPEFLGPTYVGQVPRARVAEEFSQADVFAFPTLADSFALVHLEAMALGVPVITTPHCGSVVRDGVDGFLIPVRDATALADRIQKVISDRPLRAKLGSAARERAQQFLWANYRANLLEAIRRGRPPTQ